jgi:hypothetical protein
MKNVRPTFSKFNVSLETYAEQTWAYFLYACLLSVLKIILNVHIT